MNQIQAIVLKRTEYRESEIIAELFTDVYGLIKVMVKGKQRIMAISLLTLVECSLEKGKNNWYYLRDIHTLNSYLEIRSNYEKLKAAGKMAKLLLKAQQSDHPSPLLFQLIKSYLHRMQSTLGPELLYYSFVLKLLLHEGLYSMKKDEVPFATSEEEEKIMLVLSAAKSFEVIESIEMPSSLPKKLDELSILRLE